MLKTTGLKLEQSLHIEMYLFFEKGLRGGVSYICKRFTKANNKYMKNYGPRKLSKYINMNIYLPCVGIKWLKNVDKFDVNSVCENSSIWYIFEFDFKYPDELHYLHNDYSLAPETLAIPYDMLSNYCLKNVDEYGIKVCDVKILIRNLGNKSNYVVHYKNL